VGGGGKGEKNRQTTGERGLVLVYMGEGLFLPSGFAKEERNDPVKRRSQADDGGERKN